MENKKTTKAEVNSKKVSAKRDGVNSNAKNGSSVKLKSAVFALLEKTKIYEDSYKESIGVLFLSILNFAFIFIAFIYVTLFYSPPNNFIPTNEKNEIVEEVSLNEDYLNKSEIEQWITDALVDINSFTYRNIETHPSNFKKYFLDQKYKEFYDKWKALNLITFVKANNGIVEVKSVSPNLLVPVTIQTNDGSKRGYKFSYTLVSEVFGKRSYVGKTEWSGYILRENLNKSVNGYAIVNLLSK